MKSDSCSAIHEVRSIKSEATARFIRTRENAMRSVSRLMILMSVVAVTACTTLSDKDRALLESASQNAAAAKEQSAQALTAAQQAAEAAHAAQASADRAQTVASAAQSASENAAQSAQQAAAQARDAREKADRMFRHSLRK
jgi:hypothetical protein